MSLAAVAREQRLAFWMSARPAARHVLRDNPLLPFIQGRLTRRSLRRLILDEARGEALGEAVGGRRKGRAWP